ncbi:MAG TPA: hypothetical protein VGH98_08680 [Gemmatimonadaceae bacterium]|jgi:hypothetical protein
MTYKSGSTYASRLLTKVVEAGWFEKEELAVELGVTVPTLEAYVASQLPMSADGQLRLAAFLIEKVPPLARMGHRLRGLVGAAMLYESDQTRTHLQAPVERFK